MATTVPIAIEAEKKVISALLRKVNPLIMNRLTAEDFLRPEHRVIYRMIAERYERHERIDAEIVRTELERRGQLARIDAKYYAGLAKQEYTSARSRYYAEIVREESIKRKLKEVGRAIAESAERAEGKVEELVEAAEALVLAVTQKTSVEEGKRMGEVMRESLAAVVRAQAEGAGGVPSGYVEIDKILGGFQETELIILAARPSVGKTALALNMAVNAAKRGKRVALASLEMSAVQLGLRLISMESGINSQHLKLGNLQEGEMERLGKAAGELSSLEVTIDDTAGQGLLEMRSKLRRLKHESGLDIIIIDYLQLMKAPHGENRQQEISEISRGLKGLARELKVPVIALSQLSRSVEMRAEKKPLLSDLRESGALEQDADVVLFLYREEYYNRDDPTNENIAEVIIAKNRNGPTTAVRLHFDKATMKFGNLTRAAD